MIEIAVLQRCSNENIVEYFGGYRKGDEIFVRNGSFCLNTLLNLYVQDCYGTL